MSEIPHADFDAEATHPCPHCGDNGVFPIDQDWTDNDTVDGIFEAYRSPWHPERYFLMCRQCGACGPSRDTQAAAQQAWNARVREAEALESVIEELEALLVTLKARQQAAREGTEVEDA